jgi:hypothetical protein
VPAFIGWSRLLYFAKYATTALAITNVVHVIWKFCMYSVCVFSRSTWWLPALYVSLCAGMTCPSTIFCTIANMSPNSWAVISIFPHFLGALAVRWSVLPTDLAPFLQKSHHKTTHIKQPQPKPLEKVPATRLPKRLNALSEGSCLQDSICYIFG